MNKRSWRTAICISLVLHILLFSIAIRLGSSHADYEPKPIEVELGAMSGVEQHVNVSPKTTSTHIVKASSMIPRQDALPPDDVKQTIALKAAISALVTPAAVDGGSRAVTISSSTSAAAASEPKIGNPSEGDHVAMPPVTKTPVAEAGGNGAQTAENRKTSILPYVIDGPPPIYPTEARLKGWAGKVRVRVLISEQGTVKDAVIAASSGHTCLDDAALRALQHWQFCPAYKNGRAVLAWVAVPVLFRLD
jgi:periplasmic protein TonB